MLSGVEVSLTQKSVDLNTVTRNAMKFVKFVLIPAIIIYLLYQGYMTYRYHYLLPNEFGIRVVLNIPSDKIDSFFGLEQGTYNSKEYSIKTAMKYNSSYDRLRDYNYADLKGVNVYSATPVNPNNITQMKALLQQNGITCDGKRNFSNRTLYTSEVYDIDHIIFRLVPKKYKNMSSPGYDDLRIGEISIHKEVTIVLGKNNTFIATENGISALCEE